MKSKGYRVLALKTNTRKGGYRLNDYYHGVWTDGQGWLTADHKARYIFPEDTSDLRYMEAVDVWKEK